MTVNELIEKLREFPDDMFVEINYRDDGGFYCGSDDEFCFYVENGILIL